MDSAVREAVFVFTDELEVHVRVSFGMGYCVVLAVGEVFEGVEESSMGGY